MATQAQITINGTAGSNTDLLLNSVVQLNNDGLGGEVTYEWALLSQPAGTPSAVLSSTSIQSPTFTVNKEGTYLIRLIVNKGLADEKTDTVIAAVRELETRNRIPAVGETTENGLDEGWAIGAVNDILQRVTRLTDSGMFVAYASEALQAGNVVHMSGTATLAAGLPGERKVPKVNKALATETYLIDGPLGVVISDVAGNPAVTQYELCRVMVVGVLPAYSLGGIEFEGAPVYVDDAGLLSLTPGTNVRAVGDIAKSYVGGVYDIAISSAASSLPTGAAGGDLSGQYPNPTVAKIQGKAVDTPITGGTFPYYDSGTSTIKWGPVALDYAPSVNGILGAANGGTGLSATGTTSQVLIGGTPRSWGQVTASQLADNAVESAKIASGAVTAGKITADFHYDAHQTNLAFSNINYTTISSITNKAFAGGTLRFTVDPIDADYESFCYVLSTVSGGGWADLRIEIRDHATSTLVRKFAWRTYCEKDQRANMQYPFVVDTFAAGTYDFFLKGRTSSAGTTAISYQGLVFIVFSP